MLRYALVLTLLAVSVSAASYSSVLAKYNISSSVTGILVPVNLQLNGSSYTLLYLHGSPYLLANDTNGTLVFSSNIVYAVAGNYLESNALNSPYLKEASALMHNYQNSSSSSITDCLHETGLVSPLGTNTCTIANNCQSCSTVPVCKKVLVNTGGPTQSFGLGIMQFEAQYANMTSDYAQFYSSVEYINASNAQSSITNMNSAFNGIKGITKKIDQNPIFPPSSNLTASSFSACGLPQNLGVNINVSASTGSPWYCNAVGFCAFTTYNYSALSSISSMLSQIASLPISKASIVGIARNVSGNDYSYYKPILYKQKSAVYANMLNTTLFGYGKLVNESTTLSAHISNATFIESLNALQKSYANLTSNYINLNLTQYNSTMASEIKDLSNNYKSVNSTYASIKNLSKSNTQLILEYQLNSESPPSELSSLAFSEYSINNQIDSKVGNTKTAYSQLQSINKSLQAMSPSAPLLPEITRAFDSGIVTSIEAGLSAPYASKIAGVPAYASLISLIIGIVIIAILLVFYLRLNRKHHIHAKPDAKRNWQRIFAAAAVLLIIYVIATYYTAAQASSFAPASSFVSAVNSAKSVYIINNGTSSGMVNCSKQLSAELSSKGKQVSTITVSASGLCTINGFVGNESSCIDHAAAGSYPVVVLSNSNSSSVKAYSFYGSALFASGSDQFLNQCIPAQLIG